MPKGLPSTGAKFTPEVVLDGSPNSLDNAMEKYPEAVGEGVHRASVIKVTRISNILTILLSGVALFSDGYNAQIGKCSDDKTESIMRAAIGIAEASNDFLQLDIWSLYSQICRRIRAHCTLESEQLSGGGVRYPDIISSTIKTRLSNSYLIGEIFGMLTFGFIIDKLGRRTGIVFATCFLVLGIILATAAHGQSHLG